MDLYFGFDGGGTKTASVILNAGGEELGRGRGGPCNIATCSDEQLAESVSEALETALTQANLPRETRFEGVCGGVAGYTARKRRAEFRVLLQERLPAVRHRVEPDYVIAYWGATEGEPGIIVSAGTGTVLYGRKGEGQDARVDGRGFLYGDRGSAFDVGRRTLAFMIEQMDQGAPLESLYREIMDEIGALDADDIVEWTYRDFSPARIASVAEVVARCAAAGDELAVFVLQKQGAALRNSLDSLMRRARFDEETPIYLLGSVWGAGKPIMESFSRIGSRSTEAPPTLTVRAPLHDAAYGAALLAMRIG